MSSKYKHHKYIWTRPSRSTRHRWELVGAKGGMHFHVNITDDKSYEPSCGLEFHHLEGEGAPDHINCPLTGGRCWHDGTSLYATEFIWPVVLTYLEAGAHEKIFIFLESIASEHFDNSETSS